MDNRRIFGQGMAFPPRVGPDGRTAWSVGETNVHESIRIILSTDPGERLRLPAFGAGLRRFLEETVMPWFDGRRKELANRPLIREQAFERVLEPEALAPMAQQLDALAEQAVQTLARQQLSQSEVQVRRRAHVRYEGTDAALVVPFGDLPTLVAGFESAYRQRFAFLDQFDRGEMADTAGADRAA